jgi:hypothetical protein
MNPQTVILEWLKQVRKPRKELGGKSICPFAVVPEIVVVDGLNESCFENLSDKITIYVERTINSTFEELDAVAQKLNKLFPTHIFLPDHPHKKNYIQGIETGNGHLPLIIAQTRKELTEARDKISKTDYYDYWDKDYLTEIKSYGD